MITVKKLSLRVGVLLVLACLLFSAVSAFLTMKEHAQETVRVVQWIDQKESMIDVEPSRVMLSGGMSKDEVSKVLGDPEFEGSWGVSMGTDGDNPISEKSEWWVYHWTLGTDRAFVLWFDESGQLAAVKRE
ncbi:MAG: hypothetical protein AB1486_01555 [Planctomycetota bacterium]